MLVDNGPRTADSLVHLRNGLNRLLDGIPRDIPVSLIATAPNPRWLIRESKGLVQIRNVTRGDHVPVSSGATSGLASTIPPTLARAIALRYLRQMTQHHVVFDRAPGAAGPMKNFRLAVANHPGARIIVSADGSMP